MEINFNQIVILKEFGFIQHETIPYLFNHKLTGIVQYDISKLNSLEQLIARVCGLWYERGKTEVKQRILNELNDVVDSTDEFVF
jgi:hypothetical protein